MGEQFSDTNECRRLVFGSWTSTAYYSVLLRLTGQFQHQIGDSPSPGPLLSRRCAYRGTMKTVRIPALSSLVRLAIVTVLILAGAAASPALAQQATVSLASGSAVAGGSVNLNISLSTSGGA